MSDACFLPTYVHMHVYVHMYVGVYLKRRKTIQLLFADTDRKVDCLIKCRVVGTGSNRPQVTITLWGVDVDKDKTMIVNDGQTVLG